MDESVVREFEQQQVGKLKFSQLVRSLGYAKGGAMNYDHCVLGRAYTHVTGKRVADYTPTASDGAFPFTEEAARGLGVPFSIASHAENMRIRGCSPSQIADWIEAQGL